MAISITKTVGDAYGAFFKNKTLLAIGIVGALITVATSSAVSGLVFANFSNIRSNPLAVIALLESPTFWIELVVAFVAAALVVLFIAGTLITAAAEGDKATIGDAVRNAASRYVSLVGTGIVSWLVGFLGLIPTGLVFMLLIFGRSALSYGSGIILEVGIPCAALMIIPLYISLRLSLSEMVCVVGGKRAIASVKGSWSMLKGNLWLMLGITFCIGIIEMVVGVLISYFINSTLGTFVELLLGYPSTIALVLVYMQLAGAPGAVAKSGK